MLLLALAALCALIAARPAAAAPHSIVDHAGGDESLVSVVSRACAARCERPAAVSVGKACDEFRGDSRFPQRLSICHDSFKAGHRFGCDSGCAPGGANAVCFGLAGTAKFVKARDAACLPYDRMLPRPTMINVCRAAFAQGAEARCSDSLAWSLEEYAHLEAEALVRATEDAATRAQAMENHLYEAAAAEQRRLAAEAREQFARQAAAEAQVRRAAEAAAEAKAEARRVAELAKGKFRGAKPEKAADKAAPPPVAAAAAEAPAAPAPAAEAEAPAVAGAATA